MKADLHIHTKLSNGSMGLEEILNLAVFNDVSTIAITDHDSIAGTSRAKVLGEQMGVNVIIGSEITAIDSQTGKIIDILCYSPDVSDRLEGICQSNRNARKLAAMFLVKEVSKKYHISKAVIERCYSGSTCIYKQHIMHALLECGLTDNLYGDIHDSIFNPESETYIAVKPRFASAVDVIEAIHSAGGVAVLAHPALYKDKDLITRMVELGIDGIEVYHPSASEEDIRYLLSVAGKKLLVTGGSDFHGLYNKTCNTVGSFGLEENQLKDFIKNRDKIKRAARK